MKNIKVPTPIKKPSGNWFVQIMVNGQRISITEPTEAACIARAMAIKEELLVPADRSQKPTLSKAIDHYIEARENVLSPSTIRGYRTIQNTRFQSAMNRSISSFSERDWQQLVNREAKIASAKTVQNAWRFLASVLYEQMGVRYNIRLAQVVPNQKEYLTPDQIPVFLDAVKGTNYEIPALLALCSLRRSELLALTWDDIDLERSLVFIRGAKVMNEDGKFVHKKETKNISSRRTVPIMIPQLLHALETAKPLSSSNYVVTINPNNIYLGINRVCKKAGLPEVGIHGLRHSFASLAYSIGMPSKIAQRIGGWTNDATMNKIYTHVSENEIIAQAGAMTAFYEKFTTKITTE